MKYFQKITYFIHWNKQRILWERCKHLEYNFYFIFILILHSFVLVGGTLFRCFMLGYNDLSHVFKGGCLSNDLLHDFDYNFIQIFKQGFSNKLECDTKVGSGIGLWQPSQSTKVGKVLILISPVSACLATHLLVLIK